MATTETALANAARFALGKLAITQGAIDALNESGQTATEFLDRHAAGDWGEMSKEDCQENEFSVDKELRIFSAYRTEQGEKIWIITEADRSSTTLLLPAEY